MVRCMLLYCERCVLTCPVVSLYNKRASSFVYLVAGHYVHNNNAHRRCSLRLSSLSPPYIYAERAAKEIHLCGLLAHSLGCCYLTPALRSKSRGRLYTIHLMQQLQRNREKAHNRCDKQRSQDKLSRSAISQLILGRVLLFSLRVALYLYANTALYFTTVALTLPGLYAGLGWKLFFYSNFWKLIQSRVAGKIVILC